MGSEIKVELWDSNKIPYAYLITNYAKGESGTLGKSCMKFTYMQRALNFYVKNGVKILVAVTKNNKILGRALYWPKVLVKIDKVGKNNKVVYTCKEYVDRIYYADDDTLVSMKEFINKNFTDILNYETPNKELKIENIDIRGIYYFPYTDTFKDLDIDNKILYSKDGKIIRRGKIIKLINNSRYGYFPELDKNKIMEYGSGEYISKKYAVFIKKYNGYIDKYNIIDVDGEFFYIKDLDIIYNDKYQEYFHKKYLVYEKFTNCPINKQTAIYLDLYKGYIHQNNLFEYNGIKYSKYSPDVVCIDENNYYPNTVCVYSTYLNKWILRSDALIAYSLVLKTNAIWPFVDMYTKEEICFDKQYIISKNEVKDCIVLNDGTLIIPTVKNQVYNSITKQVEEKVIDSKQYTVKYNKNIYIKSEIKDLKIDKNQLILFKV